ncbi:MAG: hypothetical protein OXE59_03865 [Bacteroidetes bacterium]|nr:hypothetical protein [Bacteroidota bacterium]
MYSLFLNLGNSGEFYQFSASSKGSFEDLTKGAFHDFRLLHHKAGNVFFHHNLLGLDLKSGEWSRQILVIEPSCYKI